MRKLATATLMTALLAAGIGAQQKPGAWTEWSEKDAAKILNDSAWGQTQTDTNTSEMVYSPTVGSAAGSTGSRPARTTGMRDEQADRNRSRATEGAYNQAVAINYRIRFLSAKPVREALAATILQQKTSASSEQVKRQMQQFIDRNFGDYIVVAVSYDASDQRLAGKAFQDFNTAMADTLKNNTYLERRDGKRVFPMDYRAPVDDGIGGKVRFSQNCRWSSLLEPRERRRPVLFGSRRERQAKSTLQSCGHGLPGKVGVLTN
ncbi:MAG TPA: hypothetical protein VHE60_18380 [Pyrinomonadaceae bacterium]|nr:hypothetical protein [Pyrinomonadaceae bacterium]